MIRAKIAAWSHSERQSKAATLLFFVILLIGIVLRCYQYFMGRSLWEDETHLALNFMQHGYLRLMQPLDHGQVAPVLFLFGIKTFGLIFGYGELALRALPFLCSILVLPLVYYVILELSGNALTALIGFFIFSVNLALIYFSAELKPYTIDVSAYLLLIYLACSSNVFVNRNRAVLLAVSGGLALLFSSIVPVVLFCIACHWFLNWFKEKKIKREEVFILLVWAIVFLLNYFLFIYGHPATEWMRDYWSFAFFPTTGVFSDEFLSFLDKTVEETFFTLLLYASKSYAFPYILLFLFMIALRKIYLSKNYKIFLYICLPIILQLALSALKLFPFYYRFILYLVPCFIFLVAYGITLVFDFVKERSHVAIAACLIPVFCGFLTKESMAQFPLWYREIEPALDYVNKRPEGMHLYMSEPANAYQYYYQRGYAKKGIYREIPWNLEPGQLNEIVDEDQEYMIFYIPASYKQIIEDLKEQEKLVDVFEYKNYGVAVVKPDKMNDSLSVKLNYRYFDSKYVFEEDKTIAIWNGAVESNPVKLAAGNYSFTVLSKGTKAGIAYPSNSLYVNGEKLGSFTSGDAFKKESFSFSLRNDTTIAVRITLDNDTAAKNEDRNTFIKAILISPKK